VRWSASRWSSAGCCGWGRTCSRCRSRDARARGGPVPVSGSPRAAQPGDHRHRRVVETLIGARRHPGQRADRAAALHPAGRRRRWASWWTSSRVRAARGEPDTGTGRREHEHRRDRHSSRFDPSRSNRPTTSEMPTTAPRLHQVNPVSPATPVATKHAGSPRRRSGPATGERAVQRQLDDQQARSAEPGSAARWCASMSAIWKATTAASTVLPVRRPGVRPRRKQADQALADGFQADPTASLLPRYERCSVELHRRGGRHVPRSGRRCRALRQPGRGRPVTELHRTPGFGAANLPGVQLGNNGPAPGHTRAACARSSRSGARRSLSLRRSAGDDDLAGARRTS